MTQTDIEEAMRLMEVSRSSVDIHLDHVRAREADPIARILGLIRDLARTLPLDANGARSVPMDVIREAVRARSFSDAQLQQCLVALDQCNVWSVSADGTVLKIFN